MESYMRVFNIILIIAFLANTTLPAYAEGILDKSLIYTGNDAKPLRSPQEIIADFQASVDKIQEEQQGLYSQIEIKNKENTLLLQKINDLSVKLLQLDYALAQKDDPSEESNSQVAKNSKEMADLVAEKDALQKKYNEALAQKIALQKELSLLASNRESVEEKVEASLATLREALSSSEKQVAEQKTVIATLNNEKEDLDLKRQAIVSEKVVLQERIKNLETQITEAKNSAAQTTTVKAPLQQRIRELSDRLDQMQADLRAKDNLIGTIKSRESKSQSELIRLQKERDGLKEQIQKMSSTYNTAQDGRSQKITRIESKLEEKEGEVSRLSKENTEMKRSVAVLETEMKSLKNETVRLKKELDQKQTSYDSKLEKTKTPFVLQIEALQKTLDDKNSDLEKKTKEIDSVKSKSDALTKQLAIVEKERDSLKRTAAVSDRNSKTASTGVSESERSVRKEIQSLKDQLDKRDEEIKTKSRMISELTSQKKALVSAAEEGQRAKLSMEKTLQTYKDKAKNIDKQSVGKADELRKEYEKKTASLTADLKARDEKLSQKEVEIVKLTEKQKEVSAQLQKSEREKTTLEETVQSLKVRLEEAKTNTVSDNTAVNESSDEEVAALKKDLSDKIAEIGTLKDNDDKLAVQLKDATEERQKLEKEAVELRAKLDEQDTAPSTEIAEIRKPLEETIEKLKVQLADQARLTQEKEKSLTDLNSEKETIEAALKNNENERDDLKKKVSDLEQELEAAKTVEAKSVADPSAGDENLAGDLEKAVTALKEKDEFISDLKLQNSRLNEDVKNALADKASAEDSVEKLTAQIDEYKQAADQEFASVDAKLKKEVEDLKKTSADSKQALKTQEAQIVRLNTKIADLNKELSRTTDEGVKLRSALATANQQKSRLEQEFKNSQKISSKKTEDPVVPSTGLQAKIDSLNKVRDTIQAKLDESLSSQDDLKKQLEDSHEEEQALMKKQNELEKKYAQAQEAFNAKNTELEQKLADSTKRNENLERTVQDLEAQLNDLKENGSTEIAMTKNQWQDKINALTADLKNSSEKEKERANLVKELTGKNEELNEALTESRKSMAGKDETIAELTAAKQELSDRLENLDRDKESLDAKITALNQQITQLEQDQSGEIKSVESKATEQAAELAKKLADAVGEVRSKEVAVTQLTQQQKDLERQLADATAKNADNNENLQKSRFELEAMRKQFEFETAKLKEDALRFGNERDEQLIKVNELQNTLKDQQKVIDASGDEVRKQIAVLNQQIQGKNGEIEAAQKINKQLSQAKEELAGQLAAAQANQKENDSKIAELQNAVSGKELQDREATALLEKELNERIEALTAELRVSQQQAEQSAKTKDGLQGELKSAQEKLADFETRSDEKDQLIARAATQASEELLAAKQDLEGRIEELTRMAEASQKAVDELTKSKALLEDNLKLKDEKIAQLESETSDSQATIAAIKAESSDELSATKQSLEKQIEDLTVRLNEAQGSVTELTESKESLESDLKNKETRIAELESVASEGEKTISTLKAQTSNEIALTKKTLDTQVLELTAQLKESQNNATALAKAKQTLESDLKEKDTRIAELETQLSGSEEALSAIKVQSSDELTLTKKNSETQVQQMSVQLKESQNMVAALTKDKENLNALVESSQEKLALVTQDAAEKTAQLESSLKESKDALKSSVEEARLPLTQEIVQLKEQLQDVISKLALAENSNKELNVAKEYLNEQLDTAKIKQQELDDKILNLQSEISGKDNERKNAVASVEENLKAQMEEVVAKLTTATSDVEALTRSKNNLEEKLAAAESKAAQLEVESAEKDEAVETARAQAKEEISLAKKALEAQVEQLSQESKESRQSIAELTKSKADLEENVQNKDVRITELESESAEKDQTISTFKAQASAELSSAKETLGAQIEQLTGQLKDEQSSVAGLTETKESLEASLEEANTKLARSSEEFSKKTDELKTLQANLSDQIAEAKKPLEEKNDILVKSLGDVQADAKAKQATIESLNSKISGLEKSLSQAGEAKTRADEGALAAKDALDKLRKDMDAEIESAGKPLLEKNQSLQAQLAEKDKNITELTTERDRLAKDFSAVSTDYGRLQLEAKSLNEQLAKQNQIVEEKVAIAKQPLLTQIDELEKKVDEQERLIEQKSEAFTKISGELSTVLKGLAVIREERDKMSANYKPLQQKVDTIPDQIAAAKKSLEAEKTTLKLELEKVQGMLDVRVQGLEADLDEKTAAADQMAASRRDLEKELDRVTKENEKLSQNIESVQMKLTKKFQEDCGVSMEEIQKPWKDKIEELKTLLEGRDKEVESFKNENERLNEELSAAPGR